MYTIDESMKKNDPDILFDLYICSNKSKALRPFRHVIFLPQWELFNEHRNFIWCVKAYFYAALA